MTRDDGVKILTESTLRKIQDDISPIYSAYADRMVADTTGLRKPITRFFYLGLIRTLYNVRASNIDHPTPWGWLYGRRDYLGNRLRRTFSCLRATGTARKYKRVWLRYK